MSSHEEIPKFSEVTQNLKDLKYKCAETYHILSNNLPLEMRDITLENSDEKTLCYVDGLRAGISYSETPILTDERTLTSQFLAELKEKTKKTDDLIAFKGGLIKDLEEEIRRFKNQIKIAHEVKKDLKPEKNEVKTEHVQLAKEKFQNMRKALLDLIQGLFPDIVDNVTNMLAHFMQLRAEEGSSSYAAVLTDETSHIVTALRDMGIFTVNPYNEKEVKLAF